MLTGNLLSPGVEDLANFFVDVYNHGGLHALLRQPFSGVIPTQVKLYTAGDGRRRLWEGIIQIFLPGTPK